MSANSAPRGVAWESCDEALPHKRFILWLDVWPIGNNLISMESIRWKSSPPCGSSDLKAGIADRYQNKDEACIRDNQIICCIEGCKHWLKQRHSKAPKDFCPDHQISLSPATYVHRQATQNLIVQPQLFDQIKKTESRLTNENSEDALSWNVFVGMWALSGLGQTFTQITKQKAQSEPELYLWGNRIRPDKCFRWPNLIKAQKELEPGKGTKTEPDIMLRVPGEALVAIEAKFRSPNSRYDKKVGRRGSVSQYFRDYLPRPGCPDP